MYMYIIQKYTETQSNSVIIYGIPMIVTNVGVQFVYNNLLFYSIPVFYEVLTSSL